MSGEPLSTSSQPTQTRSQLFGWFVMSLIAVTLLSLVGANAPSRIKLLGLYAAGYGALVGFCLNWLARLNHVRVGRAVIAAAAVLIVAGWVGMCLESYRIQAAKLRKKAADEPAALRASRLIGSSPPPEDAESRAIYNDMKQSFAEAAEEQTTEAAVQERAAQIAQRTTIQTFLVNRVSPLGHWPLAAAVLFWSAETVIACVAGVWVLRRTDQASGP